MANWDITTTDNAEETTPARVRRERQTKIQNQELRKAQILNLLLRKFNQKNSTLHYKIITVTEQVMIINLKACHMLIC
jgi:hypothetical protein